MSARIHFCTYFDSGYLPAGVTLYRSLRRHCPGAVLWVLCLDRECEQVLTRLALPDVHIVPLEDLLVADPALRAARQDRSRVEFIFTCSPALPLYLLRTRAEVDRVTYLDSDLGFFGDPSPLFDEMGEASIAIISHRYSPANTWRVSSGIYNVGWLTFRRDATALACLERWREQCLEWCSIEGDGDRYADQKYLDDWPEHYGAHVLSHPGANVGPWNLGNYHHTAPRGNEVMLDGTTPLIFFHFSGLRGKGRGLYDLNLCHFKVRPSREVLRLIYRPYIRQWREAAHFVGPVHRYDATAAENTPQDRTSLEQRLRLFLEKIPHGCASLINGDYLLVPDSRLHEQSGTLGLIPS